MNAASPILLWSVLALTACGKEATSVPAPAMSAELAPFFLDADPGPYVGVAQARSSAPAREAVVEGRISAVVSGSGAFVLMDASLPYCGEKNKEDKCPTPWDYCCETADTRKLNSLTVEARDGSGRLVASPGLGNLRECDLVAVRGELVKDEHGNVTLLAKGWFLRQQPALPDYVQWPSR
ncbi:MAG: hypothetical protein RL148_868 [Planctomycetota bacterium]